VNVISLSNTASSGAGGNGADFQTALSIEFLNALALLLSPVLQFFTSVDITSPFFFVEHTHHNANHYQHLGNASKF
jgi:hypothetical protein